MKAIESVVFEIMTHAHPELTASKKLKFDGVVLRSSRDGIGSMVVEGVFESCKHTP